MIFGLFKRTQKIPAVFMHIQKTAGTSIVHVAMRHYGQGNVISHGDFSANRGKYPIIEFLKKKNIQERYCHTPFVSGHFGFEFCSALMEDRYSFTFLRDPVERIISFYHYLRAHPNPTVYVNAMANKHSFEDFLTLAFVDPVIADRLYNHQVWQLTSGYGSSEAYSPERASPPRRDLQSALTNIHKFSFVGLTESFEEDLSTLLDALKISKPRKQVHSNVVAGRVEAKNLPESTLNLLKKLTTLDQALYDSVKEKRNSVKSQAAATIQKVSSAV